MSNHGALDQVVEPFLRREAIPFLNLRSLFEGRAVEGHSPYLRFDMPWSAGGHRLVAQAIAKELRRRR